MVIFQSIEASFCRVGTFNLPAYIATEPMKTEFNSVKNSTTLSLIAPQPVTAGYRVWCWIGLERIHSWNPLPKRVASWMQSFHQPKTKRLSPPIFQFTPKLARAGSPSLRINLLSGYFLNNFLPLCPVGHPQVAAYNTATSNITENQSALILRKTGTNNCANQLHPRHSPRLAGSTNDMRHRASAIQRKLQHTGSDEHLVPAGLS